MTDTGHIPVMSDEIIRQLDPSSLRSFLDLTLGLGGHALLILAQMPADSVYYACDWDERNLSVTRELLGDDPRVVFLHTPASQAWQKLLERGVHEVDGLLADWGVSSRHLDTPEWGFSWRHEALLDMRMDPSSQLSALELLESTSLEELTRILREYGEERHAHGYAQRILTEKPQTTKQLYDCVTRSSRHPSATAQRVFQAIRIAVNSELSEIESVMGWVPEALSQRGRACFLSFHSLEDRVIKRSLRALEKLPQWTLPHRRALRATEAEITTNPRSRSALLRTLVRERQD